ncbi:hypothetical protein RhiirB3_465742 [Rhizophagus irregularis]|nr:hypothetical protein RhiirB3_465742 [Rhizophagus irregularis]
MGMIFLIPTCRKGCIERFLSTCNSKFISKKKYGPGSLFCEVCLYASAEDADLKKNDAEDRSSGRKIDAVWATKPPKVEFAICEEMLCKSLSDLREYIMEAGLHTPPEKIKASLFVSIRPHQKRIITKKRVLGHLLYCVTPHDSFILLRNFANPGQAVQTAVREIFLARSVFLIMIAGVMCTWSRLADPRDLSCGKVEEVLKS